MRIAPLARMAGMSETSFHRHFKAVTAMSPLQYQKHIRLQEARALLLAQASGNGGGGVRGGLRQPVPVQPSTRACTARRRAGTRHAAESRAGSGGLDQRWTLALGVAATRWPDEMRGSSWPSNMRVPATAGVVPAAWALAA